MQTSDLTKIKEQYPDFQNGAGVRDDCEFCGALDAMDVYDNGDEGLDIRYKCKTCEKSGGIEELMLQIESSKSEAETVPPQLEDESEAEQATANPQLENGHLRIANELAEAFQKLRLSGTQWQILWVIMRQSYGWRSPSTTISISFFEKQTSIDRRNVTKSLKEMESKNIIVKNTQSFITSYGIQKDYTRWSVRGKTAPAHQSGAKPPLLRGETTPKNRGEIDAHLKIEKNYIKINTRFFEERWLKYPNKDGRKAALKHFLASVKSDEDLRDFDKAIKNYLRHLEIETWKRPKNGSTFFNNWRDWVNWQGPQPKADSSNIDDSWERNKLNELKLKKEDEERAKRIGK